MEELGSYQDPVRFKLYARRAEWADVTPLAAPDSNDVVAVQYSPTHADALGYFRAVLRSKELSARVMRLTADMIGFNQSDYTAWACRWACAQALGLSGTLLGEEERFTASIMVDNAKNYQLWNYRRKIFMAGAVIMPEGCVSLEMEFASEALDQDAKNYHAWAHRQAVVAHCGSWHEELEYCDTMVRRDVRNNSAWAQRAFVIQNMLKDVPLHHGNAASNTIPGQPSQDSASAGVPAQSSTPSSTHAASNLQGANSTSPLGAATTSPSAAGTQAPTPSSATGKAISDTPQQQHVTSTSASPAQQLGPTPPAAKHTSQADVCSPTSTGQHVSDACVYQAQDASSSGGSGLSPFLHHLFLQELVYVTGHMLPAPRNESCWEYFRGLFALPGTRPHEMGYWDEVHTSCCEALHDSSSCAPALDCLAEYYFHVACLLRLQLAEVQQASSFFRNLNPAGGGSARGGPPAICGSTFAPQGAVSGSGAGDVVMDTTGAGAGVEISASSSHQQPHEQQRQGDGVQQDRVTDGEAEANEISAEVKAAVENGVCLLEMLLVADPMRTLYWHHRMRELRAVQQLVG